MRVNTHTRPPRPCLHHSPVPLPVRDRPCLLPRLPSGCFYIAASPLFFYGFLFASTGRAPASRSPSSVLTRQREPHRLSTAFDRVGEKKVVRKKIREERNRRRKKTYRDGKGTRGTGGEGVRQKCAKGSTGRAGGNKAFRRRAGERRGIIFVPSATVFRGNNALWVPQSRMQPTQKTRLGLL